MSSLSVPTTTNSAIKVEQESGRDQQDRHADVALPREPPALLPAGSGPDSKVPSPEMTTTLSIL